VCSLRFRTRRPWHRPVSLPVASEAVYSFCRRGVSTSPVHSTSYAGCSRRRPGASYALGTGLAALDFQRSPARLLGAALLAPGPCVEPGGYASFDKETATAHVRPARTRCRFRYLAVAAVGRTRSGARGA